MLYYGTSGLFLSAIIASGFLPFVGKTNRRISLIIATISCFILLAFSSIIMYEDLSIKLLVYSINQTLQFSIVVDRLSAFFIFLISIVSLGVSIYSIDYIEHYNSDKKKNILVSLMSAFILSMVLVASAQSLFSFLFFWEIMALSSFLLVMFEYDKKETLKAGIFYFVMTQLSTVFLFAAFASIYSITGSFDIAAINAQHGEDTAIFLLLLLGFGIKAGIIPFHKWLPYAHPASPSNISALMSGVMLKVAIYGLMRFVMFVFEPVLWWGLIILIAGTISAILGVIYALKEHDIKRLLAYSSIENIGIIFIGFGSYIIFSTQGLAEIATISLAGTLLHTLNHALFKSTLFLSAGSIVNSTKTHNIEKMGGLIKKMPLTAMIFLTGALSISALPPFNGFISEFLLFKAFFMSYSIENPILNVIMVGALAVFALTSALSAACFVKAFGISFLAAPRSETAAKAKESAYLMILGAGIIAISCIILGVFASQISSFVGYATIVPDMLGIGAFLVGSYFFVVLFMLTASSKKTRITETWGCGILSQNSKMEYSASGFSEPIVTIFKSIFKTKKQNSRIFYDNQKSLFKEGTANMQLLKFFEEYLYMPIGRAMDYVSGALLNIQKGDVDVQIGYALGAILIILVLVGWTA